MSTWQKLKRWAIADGFVEGHGYPDWEPKRDQQGHYRNDRHRTLRSWCRDVWRAITGKSFVTMRVTHHGHESYVECYQDMLFPIGAKSGIGCDLMQFNGAMYFPQERYRHTYPAYVEADKKRAEAATANS